MTLREKPVGSLIPGDAASITIPQVAGKTIDWLQLLGAKQVPSMTSRSTPWRTATDFQYGIRTDGYSILLSKHVKGQAVEILPADTKDISRVDYGTLVWRFRWAPQWLLYQWSRRFSQARVSLLGQQAAVDLAGTGASPDGLPDQVITVELASWVMNQIRDWRIELADNRGEWLTSINTGGLWLIAKDFPPDLQREPGKRVVRLCFKDNGSVDSAPAIHLQAFDSLGQLVIESTVNRQ